MLGRNPVRVHRLALGRFLDSRDGISIRVSIFLLGSVLRDVQLASITRSLAYILYTK